MSEETKKKETKEINEELENETQSDQPGLSWLRSIVTNCVWEKRPRMALLRRDALVGVSNAISNVPDGMANGVLVGINPIHGLYATMVGPITGGMFSSTQLMIITTTAAASLTSSDALSGISGEARTSALFLMVILIGACQLLFGLLGFGRFFRFVPYSVTTGFLSGIAVLLILSQLPTITSYSTTGDNNIIRTINLLQHFEQISLSSIFIAGLTLALAIVLPRTPLSKLGRLVGIIIPSVIVITLGLDDVALVRDSGEIPQNFPVPHFPAFSTITPDILTGALAVAVIILIQGAGVSHTVPNPDGSRRSTSRDFSAQGAANIVSGFFQGLPVGGSLSATALSLLYGAQSRWAAIFTGVWMALILTLIPGLVGYVAMPSLGALLILAGIRSIKVHDIQLVWYTSWTSRLVGVSTFLAMLFLSIQAAVGIGVLLSALLYVNRSSTDISLVELTELPDGRLIEKPPPKTLPSDQATILDIYGHMFYAGAQTIGRLLPSVDSSQRPILILRLRRLRVSGATLQEVLSNYADKLAEVGGRLYLTGISGQVHNQFDRTGRFQLSGPIEVYDATPIRGESTRRALSDAKAWLVKKKSEESETEIDTL